jgi:hypothetical protein
VPVRADVETSIEQSKSKEVDRARQRGVAPMISVHVRQCLVIFNGCIHIAQMYWARPRPGFWSDKLQLLFPTSPVINPPGPVYLICPRVIHPTRTQPPCSLASECSPRPSWRRLASGRRRCTCTGKPARMEPWRWAYRGH